MNQHLQTILNFIQQSEHLTDDEKTALSKAAKDAAKELEITSFKLDRTEKVKRTTAILLEETIEELEQKRKAVEAQNRELEIESSLERVRTVAMSMNKPDDMLDVCKTISHQLELLDVKEIRNVQTAIFYEGKGTYMNYEYYAKHDKTFITETSYTNHKMPKAFAAQMLKGKGEFFTRFISKDELPDWIAYQKTTNVFIDTFLETASSLSYYWFSLGPVALGISTYQPLKEEDFILFKRFLKVFELAYRRYLDIEKAEAQVKEARIETALERVRAVAMAMKNSDELLSVCEVMFTELTALGISNIRNAQVAIENNERQSYFFYVYSDFEKITAGEAGYNSSPIVQRLYSELGKSEDAFYEREYSKVEMDEWRSWRKSLSPLNDPREETAAFMCFYMYSIGKGHIGISTFNAITQEQLQIVKRFRNVFELSYRRFDDLQKAEAQAREAQIEAALERVRSRSMGMQKSEELKEVIQIVYEQFVHLNIHVEHTGFIMDYKERDDMLIWLADQHAVPFQITIPYFNSAHWNSFNKAKATGKDFFTNHLSFEEKNKFYQDLFKLFPVPEEAKEYYFSCPGLAISTVLLDNVGLYIENFSATPYSDEDNKTLMRFGKVFQQTYTRFNDLKQAEAQAREAQIEASLERVRSRAMAMQNSNELTDLVLTVFTELTKLDISLTRCAVSIMNEDATAWTEWTAEIDKSAEAYYVSNSGFPYHKALIKAWQQRRAKWVYDLHGEEMQSLTKYLVTKSGYKRIPEEVKKIMLNTPCIFLSHSFNNFGFIRADSLKPVADENIEILYRFAKVFDLSYTRFKDLKQAEAQAREAKIEAALERVRSRTLAMQKSDELSETSAVLFKQLINLGISPNRLYISIMKDDKGETEFWITDEDGSKVSMAYEDNLNNNPSFKKMFDGWKQQKKSLVIDMKGKELKKYLNYLSSIHVPFKGGLTQKRRWQYIAYFSKGFIGMASPDEQPKETIDLLERFAYVFNLTFTRFNDLQIAEAHAVQAEHDLIEIKAARKKAEETLTELQSTQKQLVQSEKMASLGELTAGIAHEIQNPLNFVNNFSEVSKELIDEMKAALESGNKDEAEEIANDIIQNLEKINHHGKRADAIVKGMLQHSRQTKGIKEPTDINALCDEYLRLSYHGLRAKDKNFNAVLMEMGIKTDFDESIGMINIVPQDIGRVLLNLFNNAFYSVSEKQKTAAENYKPLVTVTTKSPSLSEKGWVEVVVKDNGNGIPQNIIDKIFQPFFTTKPTGQGTGLGLSLAYDIITKEHNGTIKVESKEGEGSTFIINLPTV